MDPLDTSALPPGFGFHPTDVELVSYYLRKKIFGAKSEVEVIPEVDIYKHEPWDLPAKARIPSRDGKWHFFNTRDRKYPTGSRSNRATEAGYWKSTGKDRMIRSHGRVIGTKKTLVFHKGRPPHGNRTDWIMHEYYLNESECKKGTLKDAFVLCRITNRSAAEPEEEELATQVDGINDPYAPVILESLSKTLQDTPDVNGEFVELPSHEELNCEAWIRELYDPNFSTIPAATGCKIELEEVDSGFVYPIELGASQFPMNLENVALIGGSSLHYPQELDILPEELFWDNIVAESNFEVDVTPSLGSHISLWGFTDSPESGITQCGTYESAARDIPVNHITETGIQIRERPARTFDGPSSHRIKLQVHKMAKKNTEATNHIVILENTNCHLDFGGLQEPVIPKKVQAPKQDTPRIKEEIKLEEIKLEEIKLEEIKLEEPQAEIRENYIFKRYSPEVHGVSSSRFRVRATVKKLVRRAFREAHVLKSRCAPISPKCMFRGTCLTGAAAAFTGYIIQEHA